MSRAEKNSERLAGVFALLSIAALALMFAKPNFTSASRPQHGLNDPVLALQMAHDVTDVDAILGDAPSADRETMRVKQYEDFGFIVGYGLLYLALARMLARTHPNLERLALAGAALGVATAVLDVVENLAILRVVNVPLAATTQAMVNAIHIPSMIKWLCGFLALGSLSLYFLLDRRRTAKVVGGIDMLAAIVGLAALAENTLFVEAAALIGLGLAGAAIVLLLIP